MSASSEFWHWKASRSTRGYSRAPISDDKLLLGSALEPLKDFHLFDRPCARFFIGLKLTTIPQELFPAKEHLSDNLMLVQLSIQVWIPG